MSVALQVTGGAGRRLQAALGLAPGPGPSSFLLQTPTLPCGRQT